MDTKPKVSISVMRGTTPLRVVVMTDAKTLAALLQHALRSERILNGLTVAEAISSNPLDLLMREVGGNKYIEGERLREVEGTPQRTARLMRQKARYHERKQEQLQFVIED